jgi:hypothetical protein
MAVTQTFGSLVDRGANGGLAGNDVFFYVFLKKISLCALMSLELLTRLSVGSLMANVPALPLSMMDLSFSSYPNMP